MIGWFDSFGDGEWKGIFVFVSFIGRRRVSVFLLDKFGEVKM